jgi:hypothetical protein
MKIKIGFLLIVTFALAGCTPRTAQEGTPLAATTVTPIPSATASLAQVTATATEAASATPTAMPEPVLTPTPLPTLAPTGLPTLSPTSVPTQTPAPTVTSTATPAPAATATATAAASWWEVSTLLVGPGDPGRLYAFQHRVDKAYTYPEDVRLLVSDDGGQTWSPFPGELPAKDCVHNVNMDYARVDALYASTCRGLYRWSGSGWDLVSPPETTLVAVVYGQPQVLWAVQSPDKGPVVIRSDDGGVTWTPAADGLVYFNGVATLGIDPTDSNRLFAVIYPKYAGSYLRRGNSSGQWETMPTPNDNTVIDPGLAIDGATGDLYVVTWVPTYQLWRSRNPGADLADIQWELLHDFGPDLWAHLLASGPGPSGPTLYANITAISQLGGGSIDVGRAVLQRSLDSGQTWTALPIPTAGE